MAGPAGRGQVVHEPDRVEAQLLGQAAADRVLVEPLEARLGHREAGAGVLALFFGEPLMALYGLG